MEINMFTMYERNRIFQEALKRIPHATNEWIDEFYALPIKDRYAIIHHYRRDINKIDRSIVQPFTKHNELLKFYGNCESHAYNVGDLEIAERMNIKWITLANSVQGYDDATYDYKVYW